MGSSARCGGWRPSGCTRPGTTGGKGRSAACRTPGASVCCSTPPRRPSATRRSSPARRPASGRQRSRSRARVANARAATVADDVPRRAWHDRAWRLPPNRVSRFNRGGLLLDRFRGSAEPADTDRPEDWVGSATRTWSRPGTSPTDEGLSNADVEGRTRRVAEVLADDPEGVAGPDLASAGPATGILVKLLDAGIRLPVHAHPTRAFAREHLGSSFGKAEAWIVLGTRTIPGAPPPHVRLGFRRPVGRDE